MMRSIACRIEVLPAVVSLLLLVCSARYAGAASDGNELLKVKDGLPACPFGYKLVQSPRRISSNGCGVSSIAVMHRSYEFTPCCDLHDACFDTCGTTHSQCQALFNRCMSKHCEKSEDKDQCEKNALVLDTATSLLGIGPFQSAQLDACSCVPRKEAVTRYLMQIGQIFSTVMRFASGPKRKLAKEIKAIGKKVLESQGKGSLSGILIDTLSRHPEAIDNSSAMFDAKQRLKDRELAQMDRAIKLRKHQLEIERQRQASEDLVKENERLDWMNQQFNLLVEEYKRQLVEKQKEEDERLKGELQPPPEVGVANATELDGVSNETAAVEEPAEAPRRRKKPIEEEEEDDDDDISPPLIVPKPFWRK